MAIEVRQVTVKSVVSDDREDRRVAVAERDREIIKKEILTECRQIVLEIMRAERER
jgi:hypothetical protein